MTAQEIRKKYLEFFQNKGHKIIPRASLVPQDDPTTLFTGSGMQPLVPYLLGQKHPDGVRLADSQTCFRAEDMDEVGDNRHTTFFEMLGNWSLGDYFKEDQLTWLWDFLTKTIELDPEKLYVTCFIGDQQNNIPKDQESAKIWKGLFELDGVDAKDVEVGSEKDGYKTDFLADPKNRIFYYNAAKNWWSREGEPSHMRDGEPGGPDSEVFYDFGDKNGEKHRWWTAVQATLEEQLHNIPQSETFIKYKNCHPNCDCGRFLEIGNSVFMTYKKTANGFEPLPKPNVDFGGGLERIAAAANDDPDVFKISLIGPIIGSLVRLSGKSYEHYENSMRVIADHLRAATWLAVDGVVPSNKQQGYVLRRLLRRAIRYAFELGIEQDLCEQVVPTVIEIYKNDFPEVAEREKEVLDNFMTEEKLFRQTLSKGERELEKIKTKIRNDNESEISLTHTNAVLGMEMGDSHITGADVFKMYDTYGYPFELTMEAIFKDPTMPMIDILEIRNTFYSLMEEQRARSKTASQGVFKGGLADHSDEVVKLHTATHMMYQAMKQVLGEHVVQRGSNITAERTRFDFTQPEKVPREQLDEIEKIVNEKIEHDLPVTWKEEDTKEAFAKGASGAFGDKYGDKVKVYTIGDPASPFSREICGGPHVEHTGVIGEGGKKFKIIKEESSSAGIRRIKAVLQ